MSVITPDEEDVDEEESYGRRGPVAAAAVANRLEESYCTVRLTKNPAHRQQPVFSSLSLSLIKDLFLLISLCFQVFCYLSWDRSMEARSSWGFAVPLFFTVALLILPSIRAVKVDYCDGVGNYAVKVSGVEFSPNPVRRGKPATFSISASSEEEISGGKLMIDVYYLGIYIHSESHNICDETSCPVTTGDFVLSHKESLPGFTPPGSYKLKMKMVDAAGKQLTCISFGFSIGAGSSVADN